MNTRSLVNILFGVSISGIIILSVFLVGINNHLNVNINDLKNGGVNAESITKDKLAADVFTTINLQLDNGVTTDAKLVQATIKDGALSGDLTFEAADGQMYSAKVVDNKSPSNILDSIPNGSITEEKLSTLLVEKIENSGSTTIIENNNSGNTNTSTDFTIADGSIVTAKLANGAVTTEKLADGSVTTMKLLDGSIVSSKLTDGIVLTQHLADSSVTTFKIVDGAITTSKLLDNIITTPKLQDSAVTTLKLADGSVTAIKIVDGNVTNGKIADGAVTSFKLGDDAVITAKIQNGAVTEAKLENGSISLNKLSTAMCVDGEVLQKVSGAWNCTTPSAGSTGSITAGDGLLNNGTATDPILDANVDDVTIEIVGDALQVKDAAITSSKLADGSVITSKIFEGSVTNGKLADGAITTNKIVDGAINSDKILDGSITNADISNSAAIDWSKINKLGSSIADFGSKNFSDLTGRNANLLTIADVGNYFTSTEVEGALQEIGANTYRNGGNSFGSAATLGLKDANDLSLITNNSAVITIKSGGNVGIGDTSPVSLLTVGNNDAFQVNSLGVIVAATGITSTGTITFPSLSTAGLVTNNSSGVLSSTSTIGASYITGNSLDFSELKNSLTLDSSTTLNASGSNVFSILNSGTGNSFVVNDQTSDTTPFIVDANGNVGIGTSTASAQFSVANQLLVDSNGNITKLGGTTNSLSYSAGALTLTSAGALKFKDNILTGAIPLTITDTEINSSLRQSLVDAINDLYSLTINGGGSSLWSLNTNILYPTNTGRDFSLGDNNATSPFFFNSTTQLLTLTNTTAGNSFVVNDQTTDTTPFVIDQNGNTGIGVSSPTQKLDVGGYINTANGFTIGGASTTNGALKFQNGYYLQDVSASEFRIGTANTASLTFYMNSSEKMRLDSSGNLVVGTTSAIGRLQSTISGGAVSSTNYAGYFQNLSTNTVTNGIDKYGLYITSTGNYTGSSGTATNNYGLYINTPSGADNNYAAVIAGGNVGIGDTSPASLLTVGSSDAFQIDSSGNIVAIGGAANSISNSSGLTLTSVTTALNLQPDGAIDVNIAGGSSGTGCTVNNTTGDLTCTGSISGSLGGSYWNRIGTVLSPATANDSLNISSNTTTASVLSLTSSGAISSGNAAGIDLQVTSSSTSIAAMMVTNAGSGLSLRINDDGTTSDTTPFVVDTSGNIGIGIAAPTQPLNLAVSNSNTAMPLLIQQAGTGDVGLTMNVTNGGTQNWSAGISNATDIFRIAPAVNLSGSTGLTITTGGNLGIGTASPTSLLSVGSTSQFQVNSSGNIVAIGNTASSISYSSGLTINSSATGLILQNDGSIDVDIAGGAGSTGCTINNTTGDLTCSGSISGATGGSYWNRSGTTLVPATSDDILAITQTATGVTTNNQKNLSITASGSFNTTAAGLTNYSAYFSNTSTRSTGSNNLTNIGLYATASGAQNNYAAIFDQGSVGLGTSTFGTNNKLLINPYSTVDALATVQINTTATTNKGLVIQGVSSQSADLLQLQNNSGTVVGGVSSAGTFFGGTTANGVLTLQGNTSASGNTATNANLQIKVNNSGGTVALTALNNGNIGIGDTSPASMLTVGSGDLFQVNSSGNIVAVGGTAHSIQNSSGALNIDSNSTGAINIGTSANAKIVTIGNTTGATGLVFNSGTGSEVFNSSVTSGTGASSGFVFNSNSLNGGTGLYVSSTSANLGSGTIASFIWNAASGSKATGDLFALDIASGATIGNIFNVKNAGTSVFNISQSQVTSSLPLQVNVPGDIVAAYDLAFTNPTATYIKSQSSLYLQAGENFNSSDLTFKTYNNGSVVFDAAGGLTSMQAQNWTLASNSATALNIQSGLLDIDTTNSRVGIGTLAPSALFSVGSTSQFQINSSGAITTATGITSSGTIQFSSISSCASGLQTDGTGAVSCLPSDATLKTDVNNISNALDQVMGLRGVSFNWVDTEKYGSQQEYGFIAQEVEQVAPQLVFTMGDGLKGVKYQQITSLLVNAVQTQQNEILEIQAQLGIAPNSAIHILTQDNILSFLGNNTIPKFTVKKIKVDQELIAQSVKIIGNTKFYGDAEFNAQINARDKVNLGHDSAGKTTILKGETSIDVTFSSAYETAPIVTASPTGNSILNNSLQYSVTNISTNGFTIKIDGPKDIDIDFNWITFGLDSNLPVSYPAQ